MLFQKHSRLYASDTRSESEGSTNTKTPFFAEVCSDLEINWNYGMA